MSKIRIYITSLFLFASIFISSGQTFSSSISDSVYLPLFKLARKYIYQNPYSRLYHIPLNWYMQAYDDSACLHYPYHQLDSLQKEFDSLDVAKQIHSMRCREWTKKTGMHRVDNEDWHPSLWSLSLPIFSSDRNYALFLGEFRRTGPSIQYLLLYKLIDNNQWVFVNKRTL